MQNDVLCLQIAGEQRWYLDSFWYRGYFSVSCPFYLTISWFDLSPSYSGMRSQCGWWVTDAPNLGLDSAFMAHLLLKKARAVKPNLFRKAHFLVLIPFLGKREAHHVMLCMSQAGPVTCRPSVLKRVQCRIRVNLTGSWLLSAGRSSIRFRRDNRFIVLFLHTAIVWQRNMTHITCQCANTKAELER